MTEPEIKEGNALCMEYLGATYHSGIWEFKESHANLNGIAFRHLIFHRDFNWIICVYNTILKEYSTNLKLREQIRSEAGFLSRVCILAALSPNIEYQVNCQRVFLMVTDYLKWRKKILPFIEL